MKVLALALVAGMALTACGGNDKQDAKQENNGDNAALTYAVEAGSAGEAVAQCERLTGNMLFHPSMQFFQALSCLSGKYHNLLTFIGFQTFSYLGE